MANRMIKTAQLSQPLLQRLIHYQLQQSIIQADETPVQVLNEPEERHKVSPVCGCTKVAVAVYLHLLLFSLP